MEQPLDYADRVHLMQRLNKPMEEPGAPTLTFFYIASVLMGVVLGMILLATLRACDPLPSPLPVPVPAYAMRTQL